MVTFRDGKPYKAGYRKFKMKTVAGTDDYASLAETVSRRAAEYEKYSEMAANGEPSSNYFGQKPDLLLMDGGRGQVSAAKAALAGTALADVPLYGMVKDDHHRTRAIVDSEGREIAINMNRGTFTFVTAIQDETHRFANAYRKQQMKQKSYSSTLTEVPGVGPKTAKALMTQFKSVSAVKEATPDQLENTPGVGRQMAQTIYEYFHPQGVKQVEKSGADQSAAGLFVRSFYVPIPIRHQAGPLPALQGQRISGHRDGPPQRDRRGDGGLPSPVRRGRALGAPGGYVGRRGGAGRQASAALCLHWRNVRACARRLNAIQWVLQNKRACETV